jgi:hypothetical protein
MTDQGYSVKWFGAVGNGTTNDYDSITNAINSTSAINGVLYFPVGTYKISSNLTFPSNITVKFEKGAMLSVDAGDTATINSIIDADIQQIFVGAGTYTGAPKNSKIIAQWFGVVGNGVADDTANIQKGVNFSQVSRIPLFFPVGDYVITSSITQSVAAGLERKFVIIGEDKVDTVFRIKVAGYGFDMVKAGAGEVTGDCTFKNATILGDNAAASGINIKYGKKWLFEDIIFRNLNNDVALSQFNNSQFNRCEFREPLLATARVIIEDEVNVVDFNDCIFIAETTSFAVRINTTATAINYNNCSFQDGYGIAILSGALTRGLSINNCYTEVMTHPALQIAVDAFVYGLSVTGNHFNGNNGAAVNNAIVLGGTHGGVIAGNNFEYWTATPIWIGGTESDIQAMNNYWDTAGVQSFMNTLPAESIIQRVPYEYEINTTNGFKINGVKITAGAAAPIAGTFEQGSFCYNTGVTAAGTLGWVCVTAGSPGVWKAVTGIAA